MSFELFASIADSQAIDTSNRFMHDGLNGKRPMHVHHCHHAQSEFVVLLGGTGGPQTAALLIIEPRGVNN